MYYTKKIAVLSLFAHSFILNILTKHTEYLSYMRLCEEHITFKNVTPPIKGENEIIIMISAIQLSSYPSKIRISIRHIKVMGQEPHSDWQHSVSFAPQVDKFSENLSIHSKLIFKAFRHTKVLKLKYIKAPPFPKILVSNLDFNNRDNVLKGGFEKITWE